MNFTLRVRRCRGAIRRYQALPGLGLAAARVPRRPWTAPTTIPGVGKGSREGSEPVSVVKASSRLASERTAGLGPGRAGTASRLTSGYGASVRDVKCAGCMMRLGSAGYMRVRPQASDVHTSMTCGARATRTLGTVSVPAAALCATTRLATHNVRHIGPHSRVARTCLRNISALPP